MSERRIQLWRRRTIAVTLAGVAAFGASAAWAWRASSPVQPRLPEPPPVRTEQPPAAIEPLQLAGFAKLLSPPPPAVETPEDAARAAGEQRFALLGIVSKDGALVAAVHDRKDDRVHFVKEGDTLGSATVVRVAARSVEIGDAGGGPARRYQLSSPKPPGTDKPEPTARGDG
jgi:hypothetical protein